MIKYVAVFNSPPSGFSRAAGARWRKVALMSAWLWPVTRIRTATMASTLDKSTFPPCWRCNAVRRNSGPAAYCAEWTTKAKSKSR